MGSNYLIHYQYLVPAVCTWTLLLIVTCVDAFLHRHVNRHASRGWQLYGLVVGIVGLMTLKCWVLLAYTIAYNAGIWAQLPLLYTWAFIASLSEAAFIALLLAIGGGYCITRNSLGPYRNKVVLIPLSFFVTDLILQYAIFHIKGPYHAFEEEGVGKAEQLDAAQEPIGGISLLVLMICVVINLGALMLSWIYTFDLLSREIESLKEQLGIGPDKSPLDNDNENLADEGAPAGGGPTADVEGGGGGTVLSNMGVMFTDLPGFDEDEASSFAERLALRDKITLMKRFSWAVVAYIVATAAVELVPLFVFDTVERVVVVGHTAMLVLFLAGLAWIFKLREDSPYLMLGADGEGGTGFLGVATELGVLESRSASPVSSRAPSPGPRSRPTAAAALGGPAAALGSAKSINGGGTGGGGGGGGRGSPKGGGPAEVDSMAIDGWESDVDQGWDLEPLDDMPQPMGPALNGGAAPGQQQQQQHSVTTVQAPGAAAGAHHLQQQHGQGAHLGGGGGGDMALDSHFSLADDEDYEALGLAPSAGSPTGRAGSAQEGGSPADLVAGRRQKKHRAGKDD